MIDYVSKFCNEKTIVGAYEKSKSIEFSFFSIHRETFNTIGRFDENFKYILVKNINEVVKYSFL
jgi:hypothetical protein